MSEGDRIITPLTSIIENVEYRVPKNSRFLCPKCNTEGSILVGQRDFVCPTGDYQSGWMPVMMHTIWTVWESIQSPETDILEEADSTPTIRE